MTCKLLILSRKYFHSDRLLGRYYRYDARFERSFFKAWKELKSLQAARQTEPEVVETETPEAQLHEFAKQTQIKLEQLAPTPNPRSKPPENGENDHSTM